MKPLDRRRLLGWMGLSLAAPAIIRTAGLIMPVPRGKKLLPYQCCIVSWLEAERAGRATVAFRSELRWSAAPGAMGYEVAYVSAGPT